MANQEQVGLLLSGVDKWNAWRENREVKIDLYRANLTEANLRQANLRQANLNQANLNQANLKGAKLQGAHMEDAKLHGANLQRANLRGVDLEGADLNGASLLWAKLRGVDLRGAKLQGVKLHLTHFPALEGNPSFDLINWHLDDKMRSILSSGDRSFTRSIEFAPEHRQAGIQILSYFGTVVEQKYPNQNVTVAIKQEGLLVKMTITAPTGELLEQVETDLAHFGAVVLGTAEPESLLSSPVGAMRLKHQLDMAGLQLEHARALHAMEVRLLRDNHEAVQKEVEQLRFDVTTMRQLLGQSLTNQQHLADLFRTLMDGHAGLLGETLRMLEVAVLSGDQDQANQALDIIQAEEPQLLTRLKDMAQKVSESGVTHMLKKLIDAWQGG